VAPGGQYTFNFALKAPATSTTVTTTWRMVHEGVAFFGGTASQVVTVSCGGGSVDCTSGIQRSSENPRYLADPVTGQAVVLTGQGSIVPAMYSVEQTRSYIDRFRASGIRYARVWTLQLADEANWPWRITADGPYFDQGIYWDWNPAYWDRLRAALAYADSADPSQVVYAEVQLFDTGCIGWDHGPFVNSTDPASAACAAFLASGLSEGSLQAMWVEKLISETCQFRNMFYEIQNEPWDTFGKFIQKDQAFTEWWSQFVKARTQRAVAISFVPPGDLSRILNELGTWDLAGVDILNIHNNNPDPLVVASQVNAYASLGKVVSLDEFANGACSGGQCAAGGEGLDVARRAAWAALSTGAHFHMEDLDGPMPPPELVSGILHNINAFKQRWQFSRFSPSTTVTVRNAAGDAQVASFCMTESGLGSSPPDHVCYVPSVPLGDDAIRIQLPPLPASDGDWRAYLWNPRGDGADYVGEYQASTPTEVVVELPASEPDAGKRDWVLHVVPGPATPSVLESPQ
jgi:hypothetical protein